MKENKTAVLIAIIGLLGVIIAALINNWNNIFNSHREKAENVIQNKPATTIFEDYFDDNRNSWGTGAYPWGTETIKNGKLIIDVVKPKQQAFINIPHVNLDSFSSFTIEMRTKWLGNNEDGQYLGYGLSRDPFSFLVFANGDRRLVEFNPSSKLIENVVVDWGGVNPFIRLMGTDENILKISYNEGIANFYSNNGLLYSKPLTFKSDDISIQVQGTEKVEFDNIVVKGIPKN